MTTIKCKCKMCRMGVMYHWYCTRFQELTTSETLELCKQHPIM